jgi:invasion protein IalB
VKRALVLFSLVAASFAFAATSIEASDPRALQLTYEPWTKICFGALNCVVAAGARGACAPSGGSVSIAVRDSESASLSVNFGTKLKLDGPISVQIDHDTPILISNPECRGSSCGGKFDINSEFIERLKRSQVIAIEITNSAHQKINISLADFAKAYDGSGHEPKVREEVLTSEKMKDLMQRAEALQCEE